MCEATTTVRTINKEMETAEQKRQYAKTHYEKNKQQYIERAQKRKRLIMDWYSNLKREHGCLLCDENEPCAIDHHHLSDKDVEVSNIVKRGSSKKVLAELNKGVFLCACCHRKVHAGVLELPPDTKPLLIESMSL